MDTGERIIIDYAWRTLLEAQNKERNLLADEQARIRETFYRANKHWFDTRPLPQTWKER